MYEKGQLARRSDFTKGIIVTLQKKVKRCGMCRIPNIEPYSTRIKDNVECSDEKRGVEGKSFHTKDVVWIQKRMRN